MARSVKGGVRSITRPAKFEPFKDPAVLTANAEKSVKQFSDMLRRSREANGHKDGDTKCKCGYCGGGHG